MEWITTSTILEGLSDQANREAWQRLVARFRRPIQAFCRRTGHNEADAEDIAQETLASFAEAYRNGKYDRSKGRLSRWLFGIAFRVALSKRRSMLRRAALTPQAESLSWIDDVEDEAATRSWDEEWERSLLELCLQRVRQEVEPATMRAFELVMAADRTPAQAALELGVPVKAVYNAKYTVLKRLRELRANLEEVV